MKTWSATMLLGMTMMAVVMFIAASVSGKPKTYLIETVDDDDETEDGNDYQLVRNTILVDSIILCRFEIYCAIKQY